MSSLTPSIGSARGAARERVPMESGPGETTPALEVGGCRTLFSDGAVDVVISCLQATDDAIRASTAVLSDAERRRSHRFVHERDRNRFIVARARLRELLAKRLDAAPDAIRFEHGAHGKPALARCGADPDLRFNISRRGDIARFGCAAREIGVDLESVREVAGADDIAARFFSRSEIQTYLALPEGDRAMGFFNCWTRKEAFVKAIGDGLCHPLDDFDVSLAPGEPAAILRVGCLPGSCCGWTLQSISPGSGLIAAVVVQDRVPDR